MADIYVFTDDEIPFSKGSDGGGGEGPASLSSTTSKDTEEREEDSLLAPSTASTESQIIHQAIEELMARPEEEEEEEVQDEEGQSQEEHAANIELLSHRDFCETIKLVVCESPTRGEEEDREEEDLTSLNPFEKVLRYSQSTDFFDRQMLCRTFHEALRFVLDTPEYTNSVLEIMVNVSNLNEPSLRTELMEQVPQIAFLCHDFPDKIGYVVTSTLVPMVVRYLTDPHEQVRKTSQAALLVLLEQELISHTDVHDQVCPVILDLTDPSALDEFKTEAVALMSKMAPLVGIEMTERLFVERFTTLCSDTMFQVRKVCAANFGEFSGVIGMDRTENVLLPLFVVLCEDGIWGIRKVCADVFMAVSCACSLETRRRHLSPIFIALLTDQSRWVRIAAYQNLGPFISTFADPMLTGLYYKHGFRPGENPTTQDASYPPAFLQQGSCTQEQSSDLYGAQNDSSSLPSSSNASTVHPNEGVEQQLTSFDDESPPDAEKTGRGQENPSFNELNYWKIPLPDILLDIPEDPHVPLDTAHSEGTSSVSSLEMIEIAPDTDPHDDAKEVVSKVDLVEICSHEDVQELQREAHGEEQEACVEAQEATATASEMTQPAHEGGLGHKERGTVADLHSNESFWNDLREEIYQSLSEVTLDSEEEGGRGDDKTTETSEEELEKEDSPSTTDQMSKAESQRDTEEDSQDKTYLPISCAQECVQSTFSSAKDDSAHQDEFSVEGDEEEEEEERDTKESESDQDSEDVVINSLSSTFPKHSRNYLFTPSLKEDWLFLSLASPSSNTGRASSMANTNIVNEINQDIVPKTLLEHYINMTDPACAESVENEITRHCAYSLPAVALTLGRQYWPMLKNTHYILAGHMHWKVRRTLAFSIHELALILGEELTKTDLLPVFEDLIKDLDEVRIGVVKHLSEFLRILPHENRRSFLPRLKGFLKADNGLNWRFRLELALQLGPLSELFTPEECWDYLCPVTLLVMANEKIVYIRKTCYNVISQLARHMLKNDDDTYVILLGKKLNENFASANTWTKRQSYVYAIGQIIKDNSIPIATWTSLFLSKFLELASDRVPNIRAAVAKIITCYLIDYLHLMDCHETAIVEETLEKLREDTDKDVFYFASNRCTSTEYTYLQDSSLY